MLRWSELPSSNFRECSATRNAVSCLVKAARSVHSGARCHGLAVAGWWRPCHSRRPGVAPPMVLPGCCGGLSSAVYARWAKPRTVAEPEWTT
jgi:hypothetical protein